MTDFRLAAAADIPAITAIYDQILDDDCTGWQRGVYPTADTAAAAVTDREMYVLCENGQVLAAARLNHRQDDFYATAPWQTTAAASAPDDVLVIHTLVVSAAARGRGLARAFIAFYEDEAKRRGCQYLRLDTNCANIPARTLYKSLGFAEIGTVTSCFNGIEGTTLVLLEKSLLG